MACKLEDNVSQRTKLLYAKAKDAVIGYCSEIFNQEDDSDGVGSDSESELDEEQTETLRELHHVIEEWSQSPLCTRERAEVKCDSIKRNLWASSVLEDEITSPARFILDSLPVRFSASSEAESSVVRDLEGDNSRKDVEEVMEFTSPPNSSHEDLPKNFTASLEAESSVVPDSEGDSSRKDMEEVIEFTLPQNSTSEDLLKNFTASSEAESSVLQDSEENNIRKNPEEVIKYYYEKFQEIESVEGFSAEVPTNNYGSEKISGRECEVDMIALTESLEASSAAFSTKEACLEFLDENSHPIAHQEWDAEEFFNKLAQENSQENPAIIINEQNPVPLVKTYAKQSSASSIKTYAKQPSASSTQEQETNQKSKKKSISYLPKRKNFCIFCEQLRTNFTDHLKTHSYNGLSDEVFNNEISEERRDRLSKYLPLLKQYKTEGTGKEERNRIAKELRLAGNEFHNKRQVLLGGDILPARRVGKRSASKMANLHDFVQCKYCKNYFMNKTLHRHVKSCEMNNGTQIYKELKVLKQKKRVLAEFKAINKIQVEQNAGASDLLKTLVYPILSQGQEALVAKNDELINLFASQMVLSHREHHQLRLVSSRMRDLARLLITLRKLNPKIKELADSFVPQNFKYILTATQQLSKYDESTGNVGVISMPTRIGNPLKICIHLNFCRIVESEKSSPEEKSAAMQNATLMTALFERRWAFGISTNAEKTRKKRQMKKTAVMTDNDDIKSLKCYLYDRELEHYSKLQTTINVTDYNALNKVIIALVILINRRRAGEAARILLEYYTEQDDEPLNEEMLAALTEAQQFCARKVTSFQIIGKNTRNVPVILTKQMRHSIDLLVEHRDLFKPPKNEKGEEVVNKYLFARPYNADPYDGTAILREFREQIELTKPGFMTSTGLRHNIATMSAVKNFSRKDDLADTLGHTKDIHKAKYCNGRKEIQQGVVGEFLMTAVEGEDFVRKEKASSASNASVCEDINNNSEQNEVSETEDEVRKSHDKVCEAEDEVCEAEDEVCEAEDEVCEAEDEVCEAEDEVCKSHDEVCEAEIESLESSDCEIPVKRAAPKGAYRVKKLKTMKDKHQKTRWTIEEKKAVYRQLSDCIEAGFNPRETRSRQCIESEPCLKNRTWTQVNGLVNNYLKGKAPGCFTFPIH